MSKPEKDSLGDRMKGYENVTRTFLTARTPCIIRIDGKAFHTLTKGLQKPFDEGFADAMLATTRDLCDEIQGAALAYWQSDEISILLIDYLRLTSQAWFDKNIQKMVSVSASIATASFNNWFQFPNTCSAKATFDSRVFTLPKEEICNYKLWRQQDATRNSINSLGQFYFSHKQLMNKNTDQVQDMLFKEKGINWNDLPTWQKRGACVLKDANGQWIIDKEIPIFSQNREYINKHVYVGEE
jgi:tRNA(His) guanylyltransferase